MTSTTTRRASDARRRWLRVRGLATSELMPIYLAGILIRLLLMPFSVHTDLYSIYSRSYYAVSTGHYFGFSSQIVIQLMHDVWFAIIQPLLPHDGSIWSPTAGVIGVGIQQSDFARFLDYSHLARALFLMKLPYLAADLATGWVLTQFVAPIWRRRVLALWLLNPIVIFVSAVFGRHDSISVFLVMLSTLLALRGRRFAGMLLLGVGASARFFPAFLVPFFVVSFRRTRRELLLLGGGVIGLWLLVEVGMLVATGTSPTLTLINRYPHIEYLFDMRLAQGVGGTLFIFPFGYALLLFWFIDRGRQSPQDYIPVAAATMLLLFALTHFHPQYSIWIVPFLVLVCYRDRRLIAYHVVQIVLLVLFTLQFGRSATWDLFFPLSGGAVARLPDPMNIVGAFVPVDIFLGVVRSLFTAVSLWMAYSILRQQRSLFDRMTAEVFPDAAD